MKIRWISQPRSKSSWPATSNQYQQKLLAKVRLELQGLLGRLVRKVLQEDKARKAQREGKAHKVHKAQREGKARKAQREGRKGRRQDVECRRSRLTPPLEEAAVAAVVVVAEVLEAW